MRDNWLGGALKRVAKAGRRSAAATVRASVAGITVGLAVTSTLGMTAIPATAQQQQAKIQEGTAQGLPGTVTSSAYRISVEDTLEITVVGGGGDLNLTTSVLTDGTITYPYVGRVRVDGKTTAEVEKIIRDVLKKKYLDPQVLVRVRERQVRQVNIVGVVKGGKVAIRDGWRVSDALASVGGLPSDRTEFYTATLYQPSTGTVTQIDLTKLLRENDQTQNILLQPNDMLNVAELDVSQTTVQVVGEVGKPGPVVVPRTRSIIDVLQQSGGPTPRAALKKAVIERNGQAIPVDLSDYQKTGKEVSEKLQPGDRLVIPANRLEYYMFGAVKGGTTPYPEDRILMLSTAIADAGGATQGAELKKTTVIRKAPDGTTKKITVDLERMLKKGDTSQDIAIEPGDTIYVPPTGKRSLSFFEIMGIVQFVPSMFFLFDRLK